MLSAFYKKCRRVGSAVSVVNILTIFTITLLISGSILMPVRTEASVFSFISNLFSSADVQITETLPNSQNMALLQASLSPNQDASSTKGDISIIGGTSLLAGVTSPVGLKTVDEDQISLYVVHSGDTLPAIAKMFGVTVNTIRWGNDIVGNTITVGQTLVILPISGIQHVVKSGDTLQSIAKLHKGDLDEILQYNNLTKEIKLAVGDIVFVPDGIDSVVSNPGKGTGVGKVGPSYPVYDGYYMRPIIGGVKTQGIHGHNAVDMASLYGVNIYASAEGEVILSRSGGWNGGYGSYIILKHDNGTQTVYGHLSQTLVSEGETVTQGEVIGKMGRTGHATGVHLHFEIRGARNPF